MRSSTGSAAQRNAANYEARHARFAAWASEAVNADAAGQVQKLFVRHLLATPGCGAVDAARRVARYRVLDAGCGPGRDMQAFQTQFTQCALAGAPARLEITAEGFDCCEAFVTACRARGLHAELADFDGYTRDARAPPLDGVFCLASLFHCPRAALLAVLRKFRALLTAPGTRRAGVLLTTIPGAGDEDRCGSDGRWSNHMPRALQERYLRHAGFDVLETRDDVELYNGRWVVCVARAIPRAL